MITLTKLNGTQFVLNSDLIEVIQENPDTTIRLTNGITYIVERIDARRCENDLTVSEESI